jgi:hypothetical protein
MKTKRLREGGNLDKAVFEILHDGRGTFYVPSILNRLVSWWPIIEKERIIYGLSRKQNIGGPLR